MRELKPARGGNTTSYVENCSNYNLHWLTVLIPTGPRVWSDHGACTQTESIRRHQHSFHRTGLMAQIVRNWNRKGLVYSSHLATLDGTTCLIMSKFRCVCFFERVGLTSMSGTQWQAHILQLQLPFLSVSDTIATASQVMHHAWNCYTCLLCMTCRVSNSVWACPVGLLIINN